MKYRGKFVLDSYSLICYLEGEKNADIVADILKAGIQDNAEIYMSIINWGEIYYIVLREQGEKEAELYLKTIGRYPIKLVDADQALTLEAARLKAFYKISYADAFAAALTNIKKAKLVTGDKEFNNLKSQLDIVWL